MGTVGISYGSPTSGKGFDVSATVATIVGNLENVETPWKTQLSKLEKQDTVISNLGTLLSTVSKDLSTLTDAAGVLSYKTGASSNNSVLELTHADSSASAGTHTVVVKNLAATSSGYLNEITNSSDTLSGSITLQVGSGKSKTITLDKGDTLSDLKDAINSSGVGITASLLTDSSGTRLSLVSGTSGAGGEISVTGNTIADGTTTLAYKSGTTGADANLVIDGMNTTSSSNTVSGLIPGLTFQLLSASSKDSSGDYTAVQVVIANDTSGVESSLNTFVNDYNALVSAINTQEGNDSAGAAEPLFGSPTLSLLQQQLMSSLNLDNPSGHLDAVASNSGTTLSGSMEIQVAGGFTLKYSGTDGTDSAASTGTLQSVESSSDTLSGSISIGVAGGFGLSYSGTDGTDSAASTGTLQPIANASDTLSGSISIQVGSGTAQTIKLGSSNNTLSGLKDAINSASIGVTASIVTNSDGSSSLSLLSGTSGSDGTLTVTSSIKDTSAQTIKLGTTNNTLDGLKDAINSANIGVTASVVTANGKSSLSLLSKTSGTDGTLTVTSSIKDSSAQTVSVDSSDNTLEGMAKTINNANIGVTASVVTKNNLTYLMLDAQGSGSSSALTVTSKLTEISDTALTYAGSGYTNTTPDSGTLGKVSASTNTLSGSISIQVGSGAAQTVTLDSTDNTMSGLVDAINKAKIGVSASLNTDGTQITLTSSTTGSAGALTITSHLLDTSNTSTSKLNYNTSSDISVLSGLGITASSSADGTLSLDSSALDSVLNSDFGSVVGFFQSVDSWGSNLTTTLDYAGTSSSKGMLGLSLSSNSNSESTLNANISREELLISAESKSLVSVLNSANQTLQAIPQQLSEVNMLYSAITGYNQSS
ncbi:MAG: flagellar filament capping protein FliD [Terracidiphilus sp.]|nr:flagellar filament capping protein FliD [Terracidiphilus sp.]